MEHWDTHNWDNWSWKSGVYTTATDNLSSSQISPHCFETLDQELNVSKISKYNHYNVNFMVILIWRRSASANISRFLHRDFDVKVGICWHSGSCLAIPYQGEGGVFFIRILQCMCITFLLKFEGNLVCDEILEVEHKDKLWGSLQQDVFCIMGPSSLLMGANHRWMLHLLHSSCCYSIASQHPPTPQC